MNTVRVGLVGSGFISTIHAEALKRVPGAEVIAAVSPTGTHAEDFAKRNGFRLAFRDYQKFLECPEIDLVVLGCPNQFHSEYAVRAAAAGKHVVCEKPLCRTLDEADRMIDACKKANVKLMYAEEICFAPKYVRLKQLLDDGALGNPYLLKQAEKHDGPHSPWFWDANLSGGGVTLDMGCHAFEFFRWLLGKPLAAAGLLGRGTKGASDVQTQSHETPLGTVVPLSKPRAVSVYADMGTFLHPQKTQGDDNAVILVRFETKHGEVVAMAEESWAKKGGMDDTAEVYGTRGVAYADLLQGNAILAYSESGYAYAVEKAGITRGWSFAVFEEMWNYGFPQEFAHFVDCVAHDKEPMETGEDGRAVLEIILAAYLSAGSGKKITLPLGSEYRAKLPIELWKNSP